MLSAESDSSLPVLPDLYHCTQWCLVWVKGACEGGMCEGVCEVWMCVRGACEGGMCEGVCECVDVCEGCM